MEIKRCAQIIWAAGFIDGEGSIILHRARSHRHAHGVRHQPTIVVGQTVREPLEILVRLFGGTIHVRAKQQPNRRTVYAWSIRGGKAVRAALTDLLPYLIVKKAEAELILTFCDAMRPQGGQGPLSIDEIAARGVIADQLTALKQAGRGEVSYV